MKSIAFTITFSLLPCFIIFAQKLSLNDLTTLCSKKKWEDVNQTLVSKKWTFFESTKGNSTKYSTITWSFNKDTYSDKALGWFYLYTYEGYPNKVSYSVFNKESYWLVQNSIASAGFKLIGSEIKNDEVISTYSNAKFTLEITTKKRKDSEWDRSSTTEYNIVIIAKGGIYDINNGFKTDYYYGDVVKTEYNITNGELNGQFKVYNENGTLKKIGSYKNGMQDGDFTEYDLLGIKEVEFTMKNDVLNGPMKVYYSNGSVKRIGYYKDGKEEGVFKDFDENGNMIAEYVMSKGKKNGYFKTFNNGRISISSNFKEDFKNGDHIDYFYDENDMLFSKILGKYEDDKRNGTWKTFLISDKEERLLSYDNFFNGELNGPFQAFSGDSLFIGSYKNGNIHGEYKVYFDLQSSLFGSVLSTDTSKLNLIIEGYYNEGVKTKKWKYYDNSGILLEQGNFLLGLKEGEWKLYYSNWIHKNGSIASHSGKLYMIQNYSKGMLNGKSSRFSFLIKEPYPCSEFENPQSNTDTCYILKYHKFYEKLFYKNDQKHGYFELLDSTESILARGYYKNDLKDGEWLYRSEDISDNGELINNYQKGSYIKDKKEGKWIYYINENDILATAHYQNDLLHGDLIEWNNYNRMKHRKLFQHGKLKELVNFDSLGLEIVKKYEIYDDYSESYRCREIYYYSDRSASQEFLIKKDDEINHLLFELSFLLAKNTDEGFKDGNFKLLTINGKPIIEGKYYKENKIDLWTYYFSEQGVKIEINYIENVMSDELYLKMDGDLFSGAFTYIDDEVGVKEIRKIKEGRRNGKTTYIDIKTNKTLRKESFKNGLLK